MFLEPKVNELKKQRQLKNMTQKQLSQKAGLPVNAIYRIESGESKKTHPLRAREIAKAIGCDINIIFKE